MSAYPTRPHKWQEPAKRLHTHEELRAQLEADARGLCPICKREASEPCPCFETEERAMRVAKKETSEVFMGELEAGDVFIWNGAYWIVVLPCATDGIDQTVNAAGFCGTLKSINNDSRVWPQSGAFVPDYSGEAE